MTETYERDGKLFRSANEKARLSSSFVIRNARRSGTTNHPDGMEPEFTDIGFDFFDEAFVDKLYEIYLALTVNTGWWTEGRNTVDITDISGMYTDGIYVPLCRRIVFTDQVDIKNFILPQHASLLVQEQDIYGGKMRMGFAFERVERVDKLPIGVVSPTKGTYYKFTMLYRDTKKDEDMAAFTAFVVVKENGQVMPCLRKRASHIGEGSAVNGLIAYWGSLTLNAADDARHLWQVRTAETVISAVRKTPLVLGCDPERVKSLFYARDLPVTATGRKRPILHWVEAHMRRLKNGTDIDIGKHLRGIERFEMGGFDFEITSPKK